MIVKPQWKNIIRELTDKGIKSDIVIKVLNDEKKHSDFSASGSERWIMCPGSVKLSKKVPKAENSFYSVEGTIAHYYLEKWLLKILNGEKWNALKEIGYMDMYLAVKKAIDIILSSTDLKTEKIMTETRVSLEYIKKGMFGTTDISIHDPIFRILKVWDYKHGKWSVDPTYKKNDFNTQLVFYALGVARKIGFKNIDIVEIGILQPRTGEPFKSAILTKKDLLRYENIFKNSVALAESKKPFYAKGKWCHWCPAKDICPIQTKLEYEKVSNYFD